MVRRALAIASAVMTMAAVNVVAAPAAHASLAAALALECRAHLPYWPAPGASSFCGDGLAPAAAGVTATGIDSNGLPFAVEGVGDVRAEFDYSAACVAGVPPILVDGSGTASVTGITAIHRDERTTASLFLAFLANGAGPKLKIVVTAATLTFANGGSTSGTGAGEATFVPLLGANNACPAGGPLEAVVEGEVALLGL